MTKKQIKLLEEASKKLNDANVLISDAQSIIEDIMNEHQGTFDNKSEKWQESERGEEAQELIANLESSIESLGTALEVIEEGVGYVDDIVNNS